MSRVIGLSLVLWLTAGQDVVAICRAWCGAQQTDASTCSDHRNPSRSAWHALNHCAETPPATPALIRGDVSRPLVRVSLVAETSLPPIEALAVTRPGPASGPPPPSTSHARSVPLRI